MRFLFSRRNPIAIRGLNGYRFDYRELKGIVNVQKIERKLENLEILKATKPGIYFGSISDFLYTKDNMESMRVLDLRVRLVPVVEW